MGALNFRSRLAPYIIGLIEQKRALGYKYTAQVKILQKFDMLCAERFSEDSTVTKAMDRTRLQDFRKLLNNLFESGKCYRIEEAMEHINFAKAEISLWMIIDEVPDGRIKKCTQLSMITIEARHLLLQKK